MNSFQNFYFFIAIFVFINSLEFKSWENILKKNQTKTNQTLFPFHLKSFFSVLMVVPILVENVQSRKILMGSFQFKIFFFFFMLRNSPNTPEIQINIFSAEVSPCKALCSSWVQHYFVNFTILSNLF